MAVLDVQRRGQQIGRLRMGQKVGTGKFDKDGNEKMRPARSDTWRLTTGSRYEAAAIARLFGGEVCDWQGEFEVITDTAEIPVTVPPRDEVVSQNYELWNRGGCIRRCNSQVQESGETCACPHAADPGDADEVARKALERADLAKGNPPKACKLVTRINVMIPDLPGLGIFRLDTGSYYAAVEIGDTARIMQLARDRGVSLPAILRIEQRQRVAGGTTKHFPVPVLEVLVSFRDLATGAIEQAGIMAQLPPAPGEQPRAITAAAPAVTPASAPATTPQGFDAKLAAISEVEIATAGQQIIGLMNDPAITPDQMGAIKKRALDLGVWDDQVCTDDGEHETWEEVHSAWQARWDALARAAKARHQPAAAPAQDALPVEDPDEIDWPEGGSR